MPVARRAGLSKGDVVDRVKRELWPAMKAEQDRVAKLDRWYRWDHDKPHAPRAATTEYKQLADRAQEPWGRRVVAAVTDQLYVEGYRPAKEVENAASWGAWQANGMDARQIPLHEAATAYGLSYTVVLPGETFTGKRIPVIRGLDPSQMITFYEDPAWDDWPQIALRAESTKINGEQGWKLRLYDDKDVHLLYGDAGCTKVTWIENQEHGLGVCPVVRYANKMDLRGRADGEVEPFIPLMGRIDQTSFDRLVVQRFASWIVRTVSGMAPPEQLEGEDAEAWRKRMAMVLRVEDFLAADDSETKFGHLPATPLDGFINAHEADVRTLAALSQSPVHEMIGQFANLNAEALAAAEASLTRKVEARKHTLGESHEQTLRLAAWVMGDRAAAEDTSSQVRWRDMESRSMAQAADALGKIATMLGFPVELLWEKLPGVTQQDIERAKELVRQGGGIDELLRQIQESMEEPEPAPVGG